MPRRKPRYVGQNVPRVDGVEKVTGKAKFTGDLVIPGMLHGKILRSPYPHARILALDPSKAEAYPGVAAVLTAADISDLDPFYNGRPVIALQKVRYVGEPVAAVAAVDEETAHEALSLIAVEYQELPAAVGLEAALRNKGPLIHEDQANNICGHEHVEKGTVAEGFAQSDEIFEDTFTFPMVYHYAMEPHSVIADFKEEGITVWSSAQHPFQVRRDLARIFRLPIDKVRIIIPYLGGGFGSKSYTKFEPLVVALARKARSPVRIFNSIAASMLTVRRHAARIRLKTGVKKDGTLVAREAEIYLDTGGYADNGPAVAVRAATRVLGPYRIPHIRSDAFAVYTNSGGAGSFRAIGAPQSIFASESQMDIIAAKLEIDPAEFRLRNLLEKGEELRPKLRGMDANLASSLKKLASASQWKKRLKKHAAIGLAVGATNAGATPISVAMVRLQADGTAHVFAGSTEMGQGVRTVLSQIVAEELTLSLDSVRLGGADTSITPYDSSTGSSRSTTLMGTAVQAAARDVKKQLVKIAAKAFNAKPTQIKVMDGALVCGEARMTFSEALKSRFGGPGGELIGRGEVGPEITGSLPVFWEIGMGSAELKIDEETGEVRMQRYVSLADVGKAIHPEQCIGQEEGAAMQGLGHTLFEQMVYDEAGELINPNLIDYKVPTFSDVPKAFESILVENRDGPGPYGARGMGEGGIVSVAPAVANALARGAGVRIRDLPLTPERVWRALRETKK
jgi:CO/xanthine dehydrogenase Mo-binding subunit